MKNKTKNGAAAAEFIPMKDFSNGCTDDVLFVNGSVNTSSLWEATMSRLMAIKDLLEFSSSALMKPGQVNNETSMLTDSVLILISDAVSIMNVLYKKINARSELDNEDDNIQVGAEDYVYVLNDAEMEKILIAKDMVNVFCNLSGMTTRDVTINGNSFCSAMGHIFDEIEGATRDLPRVPLSVVSGSIIE
jgi:hypothetical protein